MKVRYRHILIWMICLCWQTLSGQSYSLSGVVIADGTDGPVPEVLVYSTKAGQSTNTDGQGRFQLQLKPGIQELQFIKSGWRTEYLNLDLRGDTLLVMNLKSFEIELETVEVLATRTTDGIQRLKTIEDFGIYASKKNEVIVLDDFAANRASNTARQIFAKVPGLNIWESDFAGLQLDIAARGLGPSRTSNFNTRQNGYDMSADALGYPESYYMPALQAVERIEVVRGAASLQYGTQFGGMLNFRIKEAPESTLATRVEQTVGSYGLWSSYVDMGGRRGQWDYYGYYQYRQGDGWRANSGFDSHTAFGRVGYQVDDKLHLGLEYSHLSYEAQQPGGLTDSQMNEGQWKTSNRHRNWFGVNWNLLAATAKYVQSPRSQWSLKSFVLLSERNALGNLSQIGVPDNPLDNRTLIQDQFRNWGLELRYQHSHSWLNRDNTLIAGGRYYKGLTQRQQGWASNGSGPDFKLLNPESPEEFDYTFPSENVAFFAENLLSLSSRLLLTVGARLEHIRTDAAGQWRDNRYDFAGNLISSELYNDDKSTVRWVPLVGVGLSYDVQGTGQVYSNFARNFRSITFSDLRVVNPNFALDSNITDERGYNIDLGYRGKIGMWAEVDVSLFLLRYMGRIGLRELPGSTTLLRTNIGDSRHIGMEVFGEGDLYQLLRIEKNRSNLSVFVNLALTDAKYVESDISAIRNRKVEYVPELMLRTGLHYKWRTLKTTLQYSRLSEQFSDATNSEFNANALTGVIPAYAVWDFSAQYEFGTWQLSGGVNNFTNAMYFTRRAESYPGPGIIPATPRSFYLGVAWTFAK